MRHVSSIRYSSESMINGIFSVLIMHLWRLPTSWTSSYVTAGLRVQIFLSLFNSILKLSLRPRQPRWDSFISFYLRKVSIFRERYVVKFLFPVFLLQWALLLFYKYFLSNKYFSVLILCNHHCGIYCHVTRFLHSLQSRTDCLIRNLRAQSTILFWRRSCLQATADPRIGRTYVLVGQKVAFCLRTSVER